MTVGHTWQPHNHHLPQEVIETVTTSSPNSHLETQEKSHSYHQLSRHKSHGRKELGTGDREKRQAPNLAADTVFPTHVRIHPPTPKRRKELALPQASPPTGVCMTVKLLVGLRLGRTGRVHWNPSQGAPGGLLQQHGFRVCSHTSVYWAKFFFHRLSKSNQIKCKVIGSPHTQCSETSAGSSPPDPISMAAG